MVIRSISLYSFTLLWILSGISIAVDDSVAMAKLAASLHPAPFSWSTNSSSYCQWQYVSCDIHGRVASLALEEMIVSGYLPPEIGSLSHLRILSIMNTGVSGVIPRLDNLTSLETLYLGSNSFTRFAQGFLQGLPISLQEIIIGDNPLSSWTIPVELAHLTNLSTFDARNTSLMGRIPDIFESSSLIYLVLSFNNLSGYLPDSFAKSNIQFLYLQDQQEGLSGTIQVLSSMSSLVQVQLDDNHFTGHIPDLSNLQRLERLSLDNNLLTGIVPRSLASLYRVSFSNNKLQGPFPRFLLDKPMSGLKGNNFCTRSGEPCDTQVAELLDIVRGFGYPLLLSESWRGNDACNNWSFVTCNSKKEVSEVDFGHQNFGGTISPAFVNLTALKFLFLNDNNLTGSIPEQLTKLPHLEILDVSNNNLTGIIPKFDKSVKIATTGNHLLVKNPGTSKGRNRVRMVILLIVGTVCAGVGIFILGTRFAKYAGKRNIRVLDQGEASLECYADSMAEENEIRAKLKELELFDFKTLVAATQNFDSTNKLGQGGFGPVYKGKLQNGQEIAVKRLSKDSGQGLEEFMNEVVVISKLKHKNLVMLLGCCITKQERMLVYEYMPYKSLDFFLFDSQKQKLLDWRKRFNIIEGTCCGLLYLHRDSRPRIIHRDLKASNILLDKDFNPKISDFGIARFLNSTGDLANTRRVVGTYGYMPPEYVKKGQFSEKSDVFGFGVLILEIVSGMPSAGVDNGEQSSSILEHAWRLWNANSLSTFIDPAISSPCYHEEIIRCIHVGLLCVQEVAKDRPVVSAIISMLRGESDYLPVPTRPAFVEEATSTDSFQTNNLSTTITVQR